MTKLSKLAIFFSFIFPWLLVTQLFFAYVHDQSLEDSFHGFMICSHSAQVIGSVLIEVSW